MLSVVGCHAEAEVGVIVVAGIPLPAGASIFDRMQTMKRGFGHVRRLLLCEPRGSACRHVNILILPIHDRCRFGVIIMEPTEYVPMSGSNLS
jgi:proline racemase